MSKCHHTHAEFCAGSSPRCHYCGALTGFLCNAAEPRRGKVQRQQTSRAPSTGKATSSPTSQGYSQGSTSGTGAVLRKPSVSLVLSSHHSCSAALTLSSAGTECVSVQTRDLCESPTSQRHPALPFLTLFPGTKTRRRGGEGQEPNS